MPMRASCLALSSLAVAAGFRAPLGAPSAAPACCARRAPPVLAKAAKAAAVDTWAAEEDIGPYVKMGAKKDKVINWYGGIAFAMPALAFGVFWYGAMLFVGFVCDKTGLDPCLLYTSPSPRDS